MSQRPKLPELIPVSLAWSTQEYCYFPLEWMLVHDRNPFIHLSKEKQNGVKFLV